MFTRKTYWRGYRVALGTDTFLCLYNGLAGGSLLVNGPVTVQFLLKKTLLTSTLTLDWNIGSTLNAQPLVFSQDIAGIGYPLRAGLLQTFIGDCVLTITKSDHVSIVVTLPN